MNKTIFFMGGGFFIIVILILSIIGYEHPKNITLLNLNVSDNVHIDGNLSVKRPYAMFSDNTSQIVGIINTPLYMNFSYTEDTYLINIDNTRKNISIIQSGDYLIILSAIVKSQNTNKRVQIWIRKNGVDIPRSNTVYDFKGINSIAIISVPFIIDLNTGDFFNVMYAGDDTSIQIFAVPNTTYSPATPSIIMTMTKLSEITP